jgi:hypothetical protein
VAVYHNTTAQPFELEAARTVPSVRRLAQYRPFENGGLDLRAVLSDLVLAAAAMNDGTFSSILDCRRGFIDLWGIEVEVDELRPVLHTLINQGRMVCEGKAYRLTPDTLSVLRRRARDFDEIEQRAFREWELLVRRMRPSLSDEDIELLRMDLREWLHEIILRHGAEATLMLYPEEERAHEFFDAVDARGFERLPTREIELSAVREEALPLFIRQPTPDQRRFLAGLLNTSFYMTVLTIDPEAEQLVQQQMKGRRIYLDTNFLYAVLGAASAEEVYSSRRLMILCRDLGFELAITPWTASELRTSIARARRDVDAQASFIRPELSDTMLGVSGDKGFSRYFWESYGKTRARPKDVFDRLEHFESELERYGIKVIDEGCRKVEGQEERIRLYSSLLNSERWPEQREWVVLEHDAKCRLLVEQLRGDGNMRISSARFWFLTYDGKLPRFALRVPDNGDTEPELPFCVSPSAWVQVIRALTPRTDDFDRTVVDLLTSPFVGYRPAVNPIVVREVVGRMDHFDDASPETALAVLTDTAKVTEIERAVTAKNNDMTEETVRSAYSAKAREMEEAVAASEARVARVEAALAASEEARAKAEARIAADEQQSARDREAAHQKHREDRETWQAERRELHKQIAEAGGARDQATRTAEERLRRLEGHNERLRHAIRIMSGIGLVGFGLAAGLLLGLVVLTNKWAIVADAVLATGTALVGVRALVPTRLRDEFWPWIGAVGVIATIAVGIAVASPH